MSRAGSADFVRRVNAAHRLMQNKSTTTEVVTALVGRFGISVPQAYRYIREAKKAGQQLTIPQEKAVFTVKLPVALIERIRKAARSTGQSISRTVEQALEAYLGMGRAGGRKEDPEADTESV